MKDFAFDLQRFEHIVNPASNVHVSGTSGSDSIDNTGANVTIEAGAGDDTIRSEIGGTNAAKGSVIIYAGAGNDSIRSDSTNSTLDGGDGDDDILTWRRVTVIGGKGNDGIGLGDDNNYDEHKNLVIYNKGDGNDTIYGFNSDGYNNVGKRLQDTLQVVGADYSTVTSGNDLIVKVDKNFITLKNAAKVPVLIIGNCATADDSITWTFKTVNSTVTATGKIDGKTVATITGLKKGTTASDFSVNGDVITLSKNALTTSKVSITGNYTLALAEDVSTPAALGDGWVVSGTKAYYKTSRTSAGYTLDPNKKSITYTAEKGTNSITVSGLKKDTSAENLSLNEKIVTVSADALTTSNVTISNGYTLALADDVAKPVTTAAGWYIDGTSATYKTVGRTAGYYVNWGGLVINYAKAATSKNLTTVTGLKEGVTADDLSMNTSKKIVTLDLNALGTSTVTATNNYTFALASDVPKSKTTSSPYWTFTENKILDKIVMSKTATYTAAGVTEGYVLASNKKSVSYKSASGGETLATITGLSTKATAKNISVKNGVITLAKNALTGNVVLEGDYTLALAKDVKKSATTAAHWEISGTTAKYIATKTTAGYKLSSDKKSVNYVTASGGETLATITGLKKGVKASQLSIDTENKVITLSKNALASSTVKVKGDYTLALADDVAKTEITDGKFVVSGTSAKYVASKVTASYELSEDKKSVLYTAAGTKKTLLTITGLKAGTTAEQLSLNGRTVLLGADITSSKGATVKGADYGFDLTTVGKLVNGGSDASLLGSGGNDTLIGGKGADFISGGNVEDSYDYLSGGAGNDTIQGGYGYHTLLGGDGNDYIVIVTYVYPDGTKPDSADKTGNSYLNGGNGNDTVKGGYGNDTLLGGKGNDYISGGAGDDSLDGGDGNDTLYSGSGKNTLNGGAGNDSIYGTGTLLGGKGNDTLFSSFNTNDYLDGGAGNDSLMTYYGNNTLLGGAGNDYLRALDPKHDTYASYEAGLNYLDGGAGHDTIQGGTGDDTIYGGDGNDWIFTSSGNDYVDGGKGNDLLEAGPGNKTLLGGNGNDFCHGYESGCFMDGGAGNDLLSGVASTLLGGNDNDTLNGYEGVTMTGGAGYDVFELCSSWGPDDYTDNGTQIVTDYTAGEDKIMVSGGFLDSTETEVSGNDVIIHATWSQDGDVSISALNIKNGKGKAITFVNEKGKTIETKTFTANSSGLFAEDNFVTADDLSAITENNLSSVSEIETQNFDTLTHENLITYAK